VHTRDGTTAAQTADVPDVLDRNHPDFCTLCGVTHRETSEDVDKRLELARESRIRPVFKRLIVAPHCDDEALGCGGLLSKYPEQCSVVVLARPDEIRLKEFEESKTVLGYHAAHFFDIEDGYVGADMAGLVGMLDCLLAALRPDEVYLPYPSMHQDHISGYEAGIRAGRLSMSEGHHFTPSVYVYDVAAYDVDLYPTDLRWNTFEALDEEQIDAKADAIAQYASQRVLTPHPANSVKQHAESIGASRQVEWAEAYASVRVVRR